MRLTDLDKMIELAIEALATGDRRTIDTLVRRMAEKWPHLHALGICFALTSAAARLEAAMSDLATERSASRGYKLAAFAAADILALEVMGGRPVLSQDLLHYWQRMDPYFLKL